MGAVRIASGAAGARAALAAYRARRLAWGRVPSARQWSRFDADRELRRFPRFCPKGRLAGLCGDFLRPGGAGATPVGHAVCPAVFAGRSQITGAGHTHNSHKVAICLSAHIGGLLSFTRIPTLERLPPRHLRNTVRRSDCHHRAWSRFVVAGGAAWAPRPSRNHGRRQDTSRTLHRRAAGAFGDPAGAAAAVL